MSCPIYKIFGEPNKGVHSLRLLDFAIIDIILTIILAFLTKKYFKSFIISFLFWFILGEILHIIFKVETKFLKILQIKFNCENG